MLVIRSALNDVGGFQLSAGTAWRQLGKLTLSWKFWTGMAALAGVLLISLELYGSEELSRIVPLYSLSYVLIALIGKLYLGENVGSQRWIGITAIMVGVTLLVRS